MTLSLLKKGIPATAALIALVAMIPAQALAMTTLKQVQVSGGGQIDLLFDGKIAKAQIKPEFFNDVIQINLTDVAVYPAKISSINGSSLVKIFAYQYAPKLVRCRLTVKGKAEDYKDRLQIVFNGKVMTVKVADTAIQAKAETKPVAKIAEAKAPAAAEKPAKMAKIEGEEAALLDHVMKAALPVANAAAPAPVAKASNENVAAPAPIQSKSEARRSLAGGKPLPSPLSVLGKLAAVIALFGLIAMGMKRFMGGAGTRKLAARLNSPSAQRGWMGSLGQMMNSAAKTLGRRDKMVEVLSTHHLGPKKSIAVVRILGRTLVLGVTNESINLITQVSGELGDEDLDDTILEQSLGIKPVTAAAPAPRAAMSASTVAAQYAMPKVQAPTAAQGPNFSSMLAAEASKPAASAGVRNQIRSRLEGLKQL